MVTWGSSTLGMEFWVTPMGKTLRQKEVETEDKENLEWTVEGGDSEYPLKYQDQLHLQRLRSLTLTSLC